MSDSRPGDFFAPIPEWVMCRTEIPWSAKGIYAYLLRYQRQHNRVFPHQSTIAKAVGLSERQVKKLVKVLVACDLLTKERRGYSKGNEYLVMDFGHPWEEEYSAQQPDPMPTEPEVMYDVEQTTGALQGTTSTSALLGPTSALKDPSISALEGTCQADQVPSRAPDKCLPVPLLTDTRHQDEPGDLPDDLTSIGERRRFAPATRTKERSKPESSDSARPGGEGSTLGKNEIKHTPGDARQLTLFSGGDSDHVVVDPPSRAVPPPPAYAHQTKLWNSMSAEMQARLAAGQATDQQARAKHTKTLTDQVRKDNKARNLQGTGVSIRGAGTVLQRLEAVWREELAKKELDAGPPWVLREKAVVVDLVKKYDFEKVVQAIRYLVRCWDGIRDRIFKGKAVAPSMAMLSKLHRIFFVEVQTWLKVAPVKEEWDRWIAEHAYEPMPSELIDKYNAAKKAMIAIGLINT